MASTSLAKIEGGQSRAPQLRTLAEIIADLSQPIAPEDMGQMKKGGATLSFIPWYRAIKYLDRYAPGWNYEIRSVTQISGAVTLTVRITIPCVEGLIYREATGIEEEEVKGYGDPTSNAESMALRRAAAKFGLGLYLYNKGNGGAGESSGVLDPKPKTLGDLVTPKQLWMIRSTGREIGVDVEAECQKVLKCALEEISKRAASSFIDHLKRIGEEGNTDAGNPGVSAPPADVLLELNRQLGFTEAQLLKWLTQKFGLNKGLNLIEALESLGPGEMSMAIDLFTKKLEEK